MKKYIALASIVLCGCQTLPPKNKAQWESTPAESVHCARIGDFGTSATSNYILGTINVGGGWWLVAAEGAKITPNPVIMGIGVVGVGIGLTLITLADGAERDAILCDEFHQFKSESQGLLYPPQK